jgi:hypothetical protein
MPGANGSDLLSHQHRRKAILMTQHTTATATTAVPVVAPNAATQQQPAHRHRLMGVLPFIGVILFAAATIAQFAGGAGPDWGPVLVGNAVTYLIGWAMLGAGVSHLLFGRRISQSIGFQKSPYEIEVGYADLAMGIVALMAGAYSTDFTLAIILASSIYRVGCGLGHIRSMRREYNFAINNTAILAINFLVPAFLLFAYYSWA